MQPLWPWLGFGASAPTSKLGTFTAALDDEAKKNGWTVISMKNDGKSVFTFE